MTEKKTESRIVKPATMVTKPVKAKPVVKAAWVVAPGCAICTKAGIVADGKPITVGHFVDSKHFDAHKTKGNIVRGN
jgi:hypothetical protein